MPKQGWEFDDYGSDILGNGQAWGDMRGKVKTKQIGFVRNDRVSKMENVRKKAQVQPKTRSDRSRKNK